MPRKDHPATQPEQFDWDRAPARILAMSERAARPTVLCIAGPVGSGKSTLAQRLVEACTQSAVLISTDAYLPDYDRTAEHLRDEPGSSHLGELGEHLSLLCAGRSAPVPIWSFHEHRRVGTQAIEPAPLIVVEGIHALHESLDAVRSLGVLVEASVGTRWARWEILESTGQRGWGVERARAYFQAVADPTFSRYRHHYVSRADAIVLNNDHGVPDPAQGAGAP